MQVQTRLLNTSPAIRKELAVTSDPTFKAAKMVTYNLLFRHIPAHLQQLQDFRRRRRAERIQLEPQQQHVRGCHEVRRREPARHAWQTKDTGQFNL